MHNQLNKNQRRKQITKAQQELWETEVNTDAVWYLFLFFLAFILFLLCLPRSVWGEDCFGNNCSQLPRIAQPLEVSKKDKKQKVKKSNYQKSRKLIRIRTRTCYIIGNKERCTITRRK